MRLQANVCPASPPSQVAIPINGPIEITPFPFDVDVGFIHIPGPPCLTSSFCPQLVCQQRSKARFPVPDCLMKLEKLCDRTDPPLLSILWLLWLLHRNSTKKYVGSWTH